MTFVVTFVHNYFSSGSNHGCSIPVNVPPQTKWIALIQRGKCKFNDKVYNTAIRHNASAVIIYNNVEEDVLITMQHRYGMYIQQMKKEQSARACPHTC